MIYDITQPLFSCEVYPGDTVPQMKPVRRISEGEIYNLTDITMCVHNGTHIDAPFHFINDGKTVDQISLDKFVGKAYVVSHNGDVTADDAAKECLRPWLSHDTQAPDVYCVGCRILFISQL